MERYAGSDKPVRMKSIYRSVLSGMIDGHLGHAPVAGSAIFESIVFADQKRSINGWRRQRVDTGSATNYSYI